MNSLSALILALCALTASAADLAVISSPHSRGDAMGVVSNAFRCGGVGTPSQLRVSACDGYCRLQPGMKYDCEEDFYPSSAAPSLSLRINICLDVGFCSLVLDVELQGSSVQPGNLYTARHSIVPNDILSGQTVEFRAYIYHTDNGLEEICIGANIDII